MSLIPSTNEAQDSSFGPTLTDLELRETRVRDEVADAADVRVLEAAGVDVGALRRQHARLRALLMPTGPALPVADTVLQSVGLTAPVSALVREALLTGAGSPPSLSAQVDSTLVFGAMGVREALLAGAGTPPDLLPAVWSDLGLSSLSVRQLWLAGAGRAPSLVEGVGRALQLAFFDARAALWGEAPAGTAKGLSHGVLRSLGLETLELRGPLLAGAGDAPPVSDEVTRQLGLASLDVRTPLLEGAGSAPNLADSVMAVVEPGTPSLRATLLAGAGAAPDVSQAVFAELGLATLDLRAVLLEGAGAPRSAPEANLIAPAPVDSVVVPLRRRMPKWALPAVAMAAAALLMVAQAVFSPAPVEEDAIFMPSVANRIEIEDISAGSDAIVHVISGDQDDAEAPTIIFIDEIDEDIELPDAGDEGRTL